MSAKVSIIACLLSCVFILSHCATAKKHASKEYDLIINLRWVKSYKQETRDKVEIGLKWVLSYLGAMLPKDPQEQVFVWNDNNDLELNLSGAGFTVSSQRSLNRILKEYKLTEEYQLLGSMDVGRFVMLSFNFSDNYYAITGVEKKYNKFKQKYKFNPQDQTHLLPGQSGVTNGLRKLYFSNGKSVNELAHIAEEGHGDNLEEFYPKEFEVFDFMSNGQPRFAVYNSQGNLKQGGDPFISFAGKPSKCMWCHESGVQLPFRLINEYPENPELLADFKNLVSNQNRLLFNYYEGLTTEVDTFRFDKRSHYLAELLYITYQDPPKLRAVNELKLIGQIGKRKDLKVVDSVHHEFKFLKNLVSRNELDKHLPYKSVLGFDARETKLN